MALKQLELLTNSFVLNNSVQLGCNPGKSVQADLGTKTLWMEGKKECVTLGKSLFLPALAAPCLSDEKVRRGGLLCSKSLHGSDNLESGSI